MKKLFTGILMVVFGILSGITGLFTVMCLIVLDPVMILISGLITTVCVLITRKCYRSIKGVKVVKVKEEKPVEEKVVNIKDFKQEKEQKVDKEENDKPEPEEYHISERTEKIAAFVGKVIGCLICVGMVVGAIAIVAVLINFGLAILGFIAQGLLYVTGFGLAIALIGGFLRFWWSLVRWEHVDKKRGYVRIRRR